jgi:hypothetical protein
LLKVGHLAVMAAGVGLMFLIQQAPAGVLERLFVIHLGEASIGPNGPSLGVRWEMLPGLWEFKADEKISKSQLAVEIRVLDPRQSFFYPPMACIGL